jgi:carboxyl-terminal processing protease
MPRRNLAWLLGIVCFVVFGVALAVEVPQGEDDYALFRLMVDVFKEVDQRFEKPLTADEKRKLVENMINGGLERLDPHSAYIPPSEYRQLNDQTRGKFGGIGIQIEPANQATGMLTVISPMPGTPAYKAGILAGDVILKIDGKPTESMRLREAIEAIKGNKGEPVTLTVMHEGEKKPVDVRIVRDEIKVPSVLGDHRTPGHDEEWDFYVDPERKIAFVRLIQFSETSADELRNTLTALKADGMRGLILDLRGNPGGLLTVAVEIARMFIDEGVIVSIKGRSHEEQVFKADPAKTLLPSAEQVPMVVLINHGSASASEIVSAALQDHKRAVVVGERSFGKGSVQNVIPLESRSSALKLTTARYWRPSGKNIHRDVESKDTDEWGVMPDAGLEVKLKDEERIAYFHYRRDRDVVHTHNAAQAKTEDKEPGKETTVPFVDRALQKAVELLRQQIDKAAATAIPEHGEA